MKYLAPDINTLVVFDNVKYPVESWIKTLNEKLIWCKRTEATHIVFGGMIVPIDRVKVIGRLKSSKEDHDTAVKNALSLVGQEFEEEMVDIA